MTMKLRIGFLIAALAMVSQVSAEEINKSEWVAGMKTGIAGACLDGELFRTCYDVSRKECEDVMTSATSECVSQMDSNIPAMIQVPDQSRELGELLGLCAAKSYSKRLSGKLLDKAECRF